MATHLFVLDGSLDPLPLSQDDSADRRIDGVVDDDARGARAQAEPAQHRAAALAGRADTRVARAREVMRDAERRKAPQGPSPGMVVRRAPQR